MAKKRRAKALSNFILNRDITRVELVEEVNEAESSRVKEVVVYHVVWHRGGVRRAARGVQTRHRACAVGEEGLGCPGLVLNQLIEVGHVEVLRQAEVGQQADHVPDEGGGDVSGDRIDLAVDRR